MNNTREQPPPEMVGYICNITRKATKGVMVVDYQIVIKFSLFHIIIKTNE